MLVCPQVLRAKSFDERAECLRVLDGTIEGELEWARKMKISRERKDDGRVMQEKIKESLVIAKAV